MHRREPDFESAACCAAARGVLVYLHDHPSAKDSRRGILEFWFAPAARPAPEHLDSALVELARLHWLTESGLAASVFGLNEASMAEIEDFLREADDSPARSCGGVRER